MYVADNEGNFPLYTWDGDQGLDLGPHWSDRLMPYVLDRAAFSDPSNRMPPHTTSYWKPGALGKDDRNASHLYRVTYTLNHLIVRSDDGFINWKPANASSVALPYETTVFGPSNDYFSSSQCQIVGGSPRLVWNVSADGTPWGYEVWGGLDHAGYFGGLHFTFADGHARFCRLRRGPDPVLGPTDGSMVASFPEAMTRPDISGETSCTDKDRTSTNYGY